MAIIVEHDKRKREILENSLDIFIEEGYEDATFQKIADRCGITRTTLYLYFKNKREIFLCSIKQLTQSLEDTLTGIVQDTVLTSGEKLKKTVSMILDACGENRKLFNIILMYLLHLQKSGKEVSTRVRRRVIRLRHLLSNIIIEGIRAGTLKNVNVKAVNEAIYALIESAIFRLSVLNEKSLDDLRNTLNVVIDALVIKP